MQKLCKMRLEKLQNKQKSGWKKIKIRGDMMIDREMKTTINNWNFTGKRGIPINWSKTDRKNIPDQRVFKRIKIRLYSTQFYRTSRTSRTI